MAILWAAGACRVGDAADLDLGERDRRLLEIRAETFGPSIPARATCPDCAAELEMDLDAQGLAETLPVPARPAAAPTDEPRPLTSRDLAAVSMVPPEDVAETLRRRLCGRVVEGGDPKALDRRIEAMARAAELTTRITCAQCGTIWSETLDVAAHVWADVETAALGLLGDVAEIASAYGWSERDILSLSPMRRRAYLARARQA